MKKTQRKVALKALVGSHNYNLTTPSSDKDYKIFVIPTFDDLYFGKSYNQSTIGDTEDYSIHDIRKLSHLLSKSNVNFMEVLFSEELIINKDLDNKSKELIKALLDMKNDIARMNLPYLYQACIGMHLDKMKLVEKGTSSTSHLVANYGYDTKQASQAWRILDFLRRFAKNDFGDFKSAIYYDNDDPKRTFILDLRNGLYSYDEFKTVVSHIYDEVERGLKEKYKNVTFNEETFLEVTRILQELIRINI